MISQLTTRVPTLISQSHLEKKEGTDASTLNIYFRAITDPNSMDNLLVANPRIPKHTMHQPMP